MCTSTFQRQPAALLLCIIHFYAFALVSNSASCACVSGCLRFQVYFSFCASIAMTVLLVICSPSFFLLRWTVAYSPNKCSMFRSFSNQTTNFPHNITRRLAQNILKRLPITEIFFTCRFHVADAQTCYFITRRNYLQYGRTVYIYIFLHVQLYLQDVHTCNLMSILFQRYIRQSGHRCIEVTPF